MSKDSLNQNKDIIGKKCYVCGKKAIIKCANPKCDHYICKDHAYYIRHAAKCPDCFYRDRKIGLIKSYSVLGILILILIILLTIK
ncbi:MAG: hypothetical protein ACTSVC_12290 [Promethearchaeota archaeon]